MPRRLILFACTLANPLATAWIRGLAAAGHRLVTVDQRAAAATAAQRADWGLGPGDAVVTAAGPGSVPVEEVTRALGGAPEVIVSWWGQNLLPLAVTLRKAFPSARLTHVVDTLPDASNLLTEGRELLRYRRADPWVDGYICYSQAMAERLARLVPGARRKPRLALVEPFPLAVHRGTAPPLQRVSERPHVVFTGRADLLWSRDVRMRKDALGPFLVELAAHGVEVFVGGAEGQRGALPAPLRPYPAFPNAALFDGTLSAHLSQYDAHLVGYREWNATTRRRVAAGLSTRLALALTASAPLAVSRTSAFVGDLWGAAPYGFFYRGPADLAAAVADRPRMAALRANLAAAHHTFAFESQAPRIEAHLDALARTVDV